jgi:micrococcal nuclease
MAGPRTINGRAEVVDGDTLVVDGWQVRLKGVDAPELGTSPGDLAYNVMQEIVADWALVCRLTGEKTWGREVGYCSRQDGIDVNREIIARGAALSCPRYTTRYLPDETAEALLVLKRANYCARRSRN